MVKFLKNADKSRRYALYKVLVKGLKHQTITNTMENNQLYIIPVTPIQQNCSFLLDSQRKGIVIDPGGNPQKLFNALKETQMDLEAILLTHGHFDHIGGVEDFRRMAEEHLGKTIPVIGPFEQDGFMFENVTKRVKAFFPLNPEVDDLNLKNFHPTPSKGDRFYSGKAETFQVGSFEFEAVHTPGHSPGHAILKLAGTNVIFVGDLVFRGSVGRTDLEGSSFDDLVKSIRESIYSLPEDTVLYPGHGPYTTVGFEKENNPIVRP